MIQSCRVKDFMCTSLMTFTPTMDVMEAVQLMVEHGISGGPVVDEHHQLIGMLTEKDCLQIVLNAGYYNQWGGNIEQFMSSDIETVEETMTLVDLAEKFIHGPYRRFPVVDHDRLVGQVSRHDVMKMIIKLTK